MAAHTGCAEPRARAAFLKTARDVLRADHPFALHQLLYRSCNNDKIVWEPDASQVEKANVTQLMRERGLESHEDLHAWSVADRSSFWQSIVAKLAIRFRTKHTRVLDTDDHPEDVRFFPDSRLNIAESCFSAARSATAIVYQREGNTIQRITYGELMRTTRQVAAGLRVMGIEPGARIAIDMPMTAESIAIYLGIVWAGCNVVSIADSFAAGNSHPVRSRPSAAYFYPRCRFARRQNAPSLRARSRCKCAPSHCVRRQDRPPCSSTAQKRYYLE